MLDAQDPDVRAIVDRELRKVGRAMYERDIVPRLTESDKGMFVVMDMLSGDYVIDRRDADARIRLERRRPDAVMHLECVGYRTPYQAVSIRFAERERRDD